MKTLMKPKVSLSDTVGLKELKSGNCLFPTEKLDSDLARVVGVFSHHRDVQVALEELKDAGYPFNWITLIARNCQQYNWLPNLIIDECFNEKAFDLNRISQDFWLFGNSRGSH